MGKKFDETLKYLGSAYSVKSFEYEPCIYRKYGNHEFEISGLNSPGKYDATIYVWENERQVIQTIQNISSKEELTKHLEILLAGFSDNQD